MSSVPSLNTITLELQTDYYLLIYPLLLAAIILSSLYLTAISIGFKIAIVLICGFFLYRLVRQYILLNTDKAVTKIEFRQKWFLHFNNGAVEQVKLDSNTVYMPFILLLAFKGNNKYTVIVRRKAVEALQYDAMYIYLHHLWQPE